LTTNFDVLLELAVLQTEGSVRQLISREQFAAKEPDLCAVAKLHGSFWRWDGTEWQDNRETLCTSIESVGGQFVQYSYNSPQKVFLNQVLSNRPLLVIGYSGTDDFDISSLVLRPTNRRLIVWVQHDESVTDPIIATSLGQVPAAFHESIPPGLFAKVADGSNVVYLRGQTRVILESLADARSNPIDSARHKCEPPVPPTSPAELPDNFLNIPWRALTVAGWLQQRLAHFDLARAAFDLAHESAALSPDDPGAWWVTVTLAEFEMNHGSRARAESLAEAGLAATRPHNKTAAACFLRLLGDPNGVQKWTPARW